MFSLFVDYSVQYFFNVLQNRNQILTQRCRVVTAFTPKKTGQANLRDTLSHYNTRLLSLLYRTRHHRLVSVGYYVRPR